MSSKFQDTILQLSTAKTLSAIHVIRLSGAGSREFLQKHLHKTHLEARHVYTTRFFDQDEQVIDQVIAYFFESPASYTGEDMAEIHCHGSPLIVDQILHCGINDGLRLAERGEFTQRAFLNGKINVEQAEAIDALIRSKTPYLKQNALKILEKKASLRFDDLKTTLLNLLADMETAMEFPEDEIGDDFEQQGKLRTRYLDRLNDFEKPLLKLERNYQKARKLELGYKLVLSGRPNAGKSTLMNALLREDRVLVSEVQGTTRDYVHEQFYLGALPVRLTDTAGLREARDKLESQGIAYSERLLNEADLLIFIAFERDCLDKLKTIKNTSDKPVFIVLNKSDLLSESEIRQIQDEFTKNDYIIDHVHHHDSEDLLEALESALEKKIRSDIHLQNDDLALLNERQGLVCQKILSEVTRARKLISDGETEDIVVEVFREMNDQLNELELQFDDDQVMSHLFEHFCIGK